MRSAINFFAIVAFTAISLSHAWAGPIGGKRSDIRVQCEIVGKAALLRQGYSLTPQLSAQVELACAKLYPV